MAGSSESYHEPLSELTTETRHFHQALTSLQEELEAVDWYRQRATPARTRSSRASCCTTCARRSNTPAW